MEPPKGAFRAQDIRTRWAYICAQCGEQHWLRRDGKGKQTYRLTDGALLCFGCGLSKYAIVRGVGWRCSRCHTICPDTTWPDHGKAKWFAGGGYGSWCVQCDGLPWPPPKPKAARNRHCPQCAKDFTPARRDAKYCSGACRVAAHRATKTERTSS